MTKCAEIAETMRIVRADCEADAQAVDRTPFTARGVGETFGATLAMIAAVARAVELLAGEVDALGRVLDSQTEHPA